MGISESIGFAKLLATMTDQGMNTGSEQSISDLLDSELKNLVSAVRASGKAGKLTLTLKCSNQGAEQVVIEPDWKVTLPPAKKVPFMGFADARGNLYQEHYKQTQLPVKEQMASIV